MPCDALAQHVVGVRERFVERRLLLDDLQDALVRDRDQRVDLRFEIGDAALGGLSCACLPSNANGLVITRDRQARRIRAPVRRRPAPRRCRCRRPCRR